MVSAIGSYSGAQSYILQALKEKYASTDSDGNGALSLVEFQEGAPADATGLDKLFSGLDTNSDGSLTEDEFASGLASKFENQRPPPPSLLSGDTSQKLAELFQSVDSDSDGSLSLAEFISGAQERGEVEDSDTLEQAFTSLDSNQDGLLGEEEFNVLSEGAGPGGPGGPPPGGPPPGGAGASASALEEEDESEIAQILAEYLEARNAEDADEDTKTSAVDEAIEKLTDVFDQDEDGTVSQDEAFAGLNSLRKATMDYLISLQGQDQQSATA